MSYASEILDEARKAAAPPNDHLKEARHRRDEVLRIARGFGSVRDSFLSGSIAHGTANTVNDADCGVILDRRYHPDLGTDGDDEGPVPIVEDVREHLRESDLSDSWSDIRFKITNRAIKVFFDDPLDGDVDPTVDLIVALDRKSKPGLWIPKGMEGDRPSWDASHPQKHTRLFLPEEKNLRRTRVRVTRLAKAANSHTNWTFSSFNLAALAYFGIENSQNIADALYSFYDFAAKDMKDHLTPDPAGVSAAIKLPPGVAKDQAVARFEKQRRRMEEALDADSEDDAREALAKLIPEWIEPPAGSAASVAKSLASGVRPAVGSAGVVGRPTRDTRKVRKDVRSFGAAD